MNVWTIIDKNSEVEIEVSKKTLLYGQHYKWTLLTRQIDRFFNDRNSNVEILNDGIPLNKKDWKCYYIPLDINIELEKITARSPLKEVQNDVVNQIGSSPLYHELLELWYELGEELQFINQKFKKWGIRANLTSLTNRELEKFINFSPTNHTPLSPIDFKTLMLNMIFEKELTKKTLIIIELPELLAEDSKLEKFKKKIEKAITLGYKFIFVSQEKDLGNAKNYLYNNKVVHEAILEKIKDKVCDQLPFHCSPELYNRAKEYFFKLVDNSEDKDILMEEIISESGAIFTILFVFMYNLGMEPIQAPQGLEPNLKRFIASLY